MRIEEFEPEKAWWDNRGENEFAWKVSIDDIRERNFNLDIANPNAVAIGHGDPDKLLALYEKERVAAAKVRDQLKHALAEALEKTA